MSFDELPPDSESPRTGADVTPPSEQEASVQDAPPAGTTRRRRATRTGTAAASSTPTAETKPTRTRRTRTKIADAEPQPPIAEVPEARRAAPAEAAPLAAETGKAEAAPAAAGAGTAEAAAPTASAGSPEAANTSTVEPAPLAAETGTAEPRKRAARARTSVRAKKSDAADAEKKTPLVAEAPPAEPVESGDAKDEPPTVIESKPRVRTRSRAKRATPPAELPAEAVETGELPPVEAAAGVSETESGTSPEPVTSRSARSHRNRGRGKREESKPDRHEQEPVVPTAEPIVLPPPPPPRVIDRTVGAHLVVRGGVPQITIDNVTYPPVLFFGNVKGSGDKERVLTEVRRAARSGVHLHSTLVELPCPMSEGAEALDEIDRAMKAILETDPLGYVMPRIVFVPARGWKREYPTEIATYTDGTTGDPSITSERFWREAEQSLATLISHLRDYEWSRRIFGFHLERGEWFQPADQGYDRSMANREAFRDWLREKYKHSLVALRAAWYDGNVQFHTAEIPPAPTKPNPQRSFFETRRERRTIDFYAFTSESTARRLIALAGAIKRAADDRALVSVCYGYTFEFGHGFSGHLALGEMLESPDVDLVCGPPSYRDRKPGGAASFPAPVDAPALHGKLWLSEDDTKTFLAPPDQDPDDFNPRLSDRFQTEQAYARAMGRAYSTETGVGFMDLWGEGWLDDEGLWDRIASFTEQYKTILGGSDRKQPAEVVVLVDEKSLLHVQRGEAFFRKITAGMRDILQRSGVSYDIYLQSDLLNAHFPTTAKLYLFINPYRLTTDQRAAVTEKLQGGGRTLAWVYAPGACEERPQIGGAMEETASGAVGLTLRQQEWNSEVGSRIVEQRHPITERVSAKEIGVRERLNPSFYVEDPDATVLAEYLGSGLPSIAVKRCGNWQTVFVGEPTLTLDLLRGICRYAGVHQWTGGDDVAYIGAGWVTVHANRDGHRAIRLPATSAVYDLTERRLVSLDTREYRFFQRAGTTRTFCIGTPDRFRDLGLPNVSLSDNGQHRTAPVPPLEVTPAIEAEPTPIERIEPVVVLSEDMQTLQAVLSMDLSQIDNLPFDDLEEEVEEPGAAANPSDAEARLAALLPDAEILPPGRRRRRRGGRGRGRRRPDAVDGVAATDGTEPKVFTSETPDVASPTDDARAFAPDSSNAGSPAADTRAFTPLEGTSDSSDVASPGVGALDNLPAVPFTPRTAQSETAAWSALDGVEDGSDEPQ